MRHLLELLENKLQSLIESSIQILPLNSSQSNLAILIIKELRQIVLSAISNDEKLPNVYSISVHPEIYETLGINHEWINDIQRTLSESAEEFDKYFQGGVTIEFFSDPDLPNNEFTINSYTILTELEKTAVIKTDQKQSDKTLNFAEAYLILPNKEIFPLKRTITQIGRKNDNHLIIDNPIISRNHAQIRNINGNFMIFDLNSTSGTYVNGVKVSQALLRPGDVISIANYPLVYGIDDDKDDLDQGSTAEIPRIVDSK
ncbi:MAG TPA: FHA domain-containing protein [Anaerolineaceae bacterium]|nr:FHA domain-containing protein [Anaerolineaceae bacterium]